MLAIVVGVLNDIYSELWDLGGILPSLRSEKVLEVNGLKSTDESNLSCGRGVLLDGRMMDRCLDGGWRMDVGWVTESLDLRGWFFSHPDLSHSHPGRPAGKLLNLTMWGEEDLFPWLSIPRVFHLKLNTCSIEALIPIPTHIFELYRWSLGRENAKKNKIK